jgi:hypothetical protein
MAKPLYEASRGPTQEPLDPTHPISGPFRILQHVLLCSPDLHLPGLNCPFFLYVSENHGFALGVLVHNIGTSFALVAYLSKQLNPTIRGWAPCLRALEAASLLIQESKKLTFGSPFTVLSPHGLSELLTYKGLHSMPPSRFLSLQVSLVMDPTLTFVPCPWLNPATLLPFPAPSTPLAHSCSEALQEFFLALTTSRMDLSPELTTHGS